MSKTKDLVIQEQERQALDSLYDAKHWEVLDAQYQEELEFIDSMNQQEEQSDKDEEEFIVKFSKEPLKEKNKCVE